MGRNGASEEGGGVGGERRNRGKGISPWQKTMVGHVSRKAEVGLIGPGGDW